MHGQYPEGVMGTFLSGQVRRPGGVKAVMENVFGEAGTVGEGSGMYRVSLRESS
jgi:hypothetical protein